MTAAAQEHEPATKPEPEVPAYVVVLARLVVEAALREIGTRPPANDNSTTLVDTEDT